MMSLDDRLERLACVEPPAALDRLVRERLQMAVEQEPSRRDPEGISADERTARERRKPRVVLPLAERCVYALGLLAYGGQAVSALARLVLRAVGG
jgi:hypothetical protein